MASGSERLSGSDMVPVGLALQPVLSDRVNVLLGWARRSRRGWSRRDVVAALVFASATDPDTFEDMLNRYEAATIDDARLPGQAADAANERRPGRVPGARAPRP